MKKGLGGLLLIGFLIVTNTAASAAKRKSLHSQIPKGQAVCRPEIKGPSLQEQSLGFVLKTTCSQMSSLIMIEGTVEHPPAEPFVNEQNTCTHAKECILQLNVPMEAGAQYRVTNKSTILGSQSATGSSSVTFSVPSDGKLELPSEIEPIPPKKIPSKKPKKPRTKPSSSRK